MPKSKSSGPEKTGKKSGPKTKDEKDRKKPDEQIPEKPAREAEAAPSAEPPADQPAGKEAVPETPPEHLFPIVGVGASAGGLEAFIQLLENLPRDTGMGFVLAQHMAPRAHSMLPEILAKVARMPLTEVKEGMKVEPNHIYVTPPDITMSLKDGVLHLATRTEPRTSRRPIDDFLRSLAEDRGSRSIGVILSGTASDGVLGLAAIKAAGGITFAQDVATAKYPGMPESAIAAGHVDFILSPGKIARQLASLAQHPLVAAAPTPKVTEELPPEEESAFNQVLSFLKIHTGLDMTYYKHSTIKRRINRRMMLRQVEKIEDYVKYLRQHVEEVKSLFEDILINVTSFFRDPEVFEALEKLVFPEILRNRAIDEPIRVWVPGCASGEEAYSLAISLLEFLGKLAGKTQIQLFATDVEEVVIDKARQGIYPESITADVSEDRLRRFFVKIPGGYQVSKAIRGMCVFARQNLIKDPPFSRLDLISCRNVLIYFGPLLQKKVIPIFHFALKPGGFLLLGKSEALSAFPELFNLVDKKLKFFVKKSANLPPLVLPPYTAETLPLNQKPGETVRPPEEIISPAELQQEADRLILNRFAPAGVVIDAQMNIMQFRGHTGIFLEPAPGEASLNLARMIREDLQIELRAAVHTALKHNIPVRKQGLRLRHNDAMKTIDLEVFPLRPSTSPQRYFLVAFEDVTPKSPPAQEVTRVEEKGPQRKQTAKDRRLEELDHELATTKEYLQTVIEEQETSVEELKSSNEELMSANEELQSINEEMETSKEELQSTNEELATLNEELENRNQELIQTNNDLNNLLVAVQTAILMLGPDLRIRRFNPAAQTILNLIPGDVGRPIGDLRLKLEVPNLEQMVKEVLETLEIKELEVKSQEGRWYSLNVRPYRTADHKIAGAVLALVDVDLMKSNLEDAKKVRDYALAIIATMREPSIILDGNLRVISANDAYYRTFKTSPQDTAGCYFFDLGKGQWNLHGLRELINKVLPDNQRFYDFEMVQNFPGVGIRTKLLNGRLLPLGGPDKDLILLGIEDISERRKAEEHLRESEGKLRDLTRQLLVLQEAERKEVSCELQESLAQNLTALKMQLATFAKKLPGDNKALRREYREALQKIDAIVEQLRTRAQALTPQLLDDLGLTTALKSLCESYGLTCRFNLDDLNQTFGLEEQVSIYRVIQEALNNIQRYARASQITLVAKNKADRIDFLVEDNGRGFDAGHMEDLEAGRRGIGLAAMSERVRALEGTFEIESQPGAGTRVFFSIPANRK